MRMDTARFQEKGSEVGFNDSLPPLENPLRNAWLLAGLPPETLLSLIKCVNNTSQLFE